MVSKMEREEEEATLGWICIISFKDIKDKERELRRLRWLCIIYVLSNVVYI